MSSSDKTCENYFELSYDQIFGWFIYHLRFTKIKTKDINFCNSYTSTEELQGDEDRSIFPPRFILDVTKKSECNNELNSKITVTLVRFEETKAIEPVFFKLFIPTFPFIKYYTTTVSNNHPIPLHQCECNIPKHSDLIKQSHKILQHWKQIAVLLGIENKIAAINIDNQHADDKCLDMFKT